MAQMFSAGHFVGRGEKLAAERLELGLPPAWFVICNKELRLPSGETSEIDFIALGVRCVFAIEEKSWRGIIRGNENGWISVRTGEYLGDPVARTNLKAKQLRGYVTSKIPDLRQRQSRAHFVFPRVVLTAHDVSVQVNDDHLTATVMHAQRCTEALKEFDSANGIRLETAKSVLIKALTDIPNRPKIPHKIGDYEVLERLKSPGFTKCVRARHDDGTERILRLLEKPGTAVDEHYRIEKNFALREYDVLRDLAAIGRAPAVESYFSFDQDQFWAVPIEAPLGRSLRADRMESPPAEARIQRVLADAFRGLAQIQEKGVIHRGITPDRVYVDEGDHVVFTDFFASRREGADTIAPKLDFLKLDCGSFAAPEIRGSVHSANRSTDTFGLSTSLWFWVTGEDPESERSEWDVTPFRPDLHGSCQVWLRDLFSRCCDADELKRPEPLEIADELSPQSW